MLGGIIRGKVDGDDDDAGEDNDDDDDADADDDDARESDVVEKQSDMDM